jgi:hypothetical protein
LRAADAEISAAHGLGAPRATAVVPGADAVVSAELGRESGSGLAVDEAVALARRVTAQTIAG